MLKQQSSRFTAAGREFFCEICFVSRSCEPLFLTVRKPSVFVVRYNMLKKIKRRRIFADFFEIFLACRQSRMWYRISATTFQHYRLSAISSGCNCQHYFLAKKITVRKILTVRFFSIQILFSALPIQHQALLLFF